MKIETLSQLTRPNGFDYLAPDDHESSALPVHLDTVLRNQRLDIYDNQHYIIKKNPGDSAAHNSASLTVGENTGKVYCHDDSTGVVEINKRYSDQIAGVGTVHACGNSMVTVGMNEGIVIASNSSNVYVDSSTFNGSILLDDPGSRVITPAEFPHSYPRNSIFLSWVLSQRLASQRRHDNLVIHNNHYSLPKEITSVASLWDETGTISEVNVKLIESVGGKIVVDAKGEVSVILQAENYMCKKIGVTFKQIQMQNGEGLLSLIPVMVGVDDPNPRVDLLASPVSHT